MNTLTEQSTGRLSSLEAVVRSRLGNRVSELRIILRGDVIVLRGTVRSYYAKQLVQHPVMDLTRLVIGANAVEVVG